MTYPLGFAPAELIRLQRQHETWRVATESVWRTAGFGPGHTILDLGCGPGLTTIDLARLVGENGRVVGVDASDVAAAMAREQAARKGVSNARILTANVADADLTSEAPTGIFARWLFCYLSNPAEVVSHAAKMLQPGGVLAAIDYWHYLAIRTEPRSPLFDSVFQAVYDSFSDSGGSLDVAGRLPLLCGRAGLTVRHIEPIAGVGRPGSPVWTWISEFQDLYLPTLVERGYLTANGVKTYLDWWTRLASSDHAFVFAPPMLAVVASKP